MKLKIYKYQKKDSPYWWLKWRDPDTKKWKYENTRLRYRLAKSDQETLSQQEQNKLLREAREEAERRRLNKQKALKESHVSVSFDPHFSLAQGKALVEKEYHSEGKTSWPVFNNLCKAVEDFFGASTPLRKISKGQIHKFVLKREHDGVSNSTINREVQCLRKIFNTAIEDNRLHSDAKPSFPKRRKEDVRQSFFTHDEFMTFAKALSDNGAAWLARVAVFAYYTGWRITELTTRKWEHILQNAKGPVLYLDAEHSKNGAERYFPIHSEPTLMQIIQFLASKEKHRPEDMLFVNAKGKPIKDFRKAWNRGLELADIEGGYGTKTYTAHCLRRSFVTDLKSMGVDDKTVMTLGGWKTLDVMSRYQIITDQRMEQAIALRSKIHDSTVLSTKRLEMAPKGHRD